MPGLLFRWLTMLVLTCSAGTGWRAAAATPGAPLSAAACTFYADPALDPVALSARRLAPCERRDEPPDGRATYTLISGLKIVAAPGDPLEFSHALMRLDEERVLFRFADGEVIEAPTRPARSVRPLTTSEMYFTVPWRPVPLTAVVVRTRGYENDRVVADLTRIAPASDNDALALRQHLLHGLFGGAILSMLLYNLLLWRGLRYGFLGRYCLIGAAMLVFGLFWSGIAAWILPGVTPKRQVLASIVGYALMVAALPGFVRSFLEPAFRPHRSLRAAQHAANFALAAAVVAMAEPPELWRLLDMVAMGGILLSLCLVFAASLVAIRAGSLAARYFLIAWIAPILYAGWRTLWGFGIEIGPNPQTDIAPFALMALEAVLGSLGMAWRIRSLRTERDDARAIRADLQRLADTDSMTGLLNRRAFLAAAAKRTAAQRLMLIDIDRFKAINDLLGHAVGDDVIVAVARVLVAAAPAGAVVGRLGGEEFAILADIRDAEGLDDRLLRTIAAAPMPEGLTLTCSAGIALGHAGTPTEWERLYRDADRALYRAKAGGRDRLCQLELSAAA